MGRRLKTQETRRRAIASAPSTSRQPPHPFDDLRDAEPLDPPTAGEHDDDLPPRCRLNVNPHRHEQRPLDLLLSLPRSHVGRDHLDLDFRLLEIHAARRQRKPCQGL